MSTVKLADCTVGYCTNVHAGTDLATIRQNLLEYSAQVRERLGGSKTLPVGLWIPHQASCDLESISELEDFRDFMGEHGLQAYTINGFPYDNFHQSVVKQRVYVPGWWSDTRLKYTQRLAKILAALLPEAEPVGSISTLPLGWMSNPHDEVGKGDPDKLFELAGENLRALSRSLQKVEEETGRRIVVAIEPEPGCALDTTNDVIEFFDKQLSDTVDRTYITVCHDVCHSAVMMEPQEEVLRRFSEHEITIGKVQVSSAVVADWQAMDPAEKQAASAQLSDFAEDRYLHQTGCLGEDGAFRLAEDLPELLGDPRADKRWVVHFHVPIFLEKFGHLTTSRDDVLQCLRTLNEASQSDKASIEFTGHLEVETYAWTVLPEEMRRHGLAEDIASELQWLHDSIASMTKNS